MKNIVLSDVYDVVLNMYDKAKTQSTNEDLPFNVRSILRHYSQAYSKVLFELRKLDEK